MSDNTNPANSIPSDILPVAPNPEILRRARKRESNRKDYQKHKERRRRNRPRISELRTREARLAENEARLAEHEARLIDREAQLINFIYANGLIPPEPPNMTMVFSSNMASSSIPYSDLFPGNEEVDLCEGHTQTLSSVVSGDSLFETELYNLESNEIELGEDHTQTFSSLISIDPFLDPNV
ncbi:hypothetical protein F8M41_011128 [Gigaspora margarita]|uniref:Uncharacterized protein n=1 Tax=Gigaspora margarita TaxID=4874 RepID=A0A8H3X157_GIGMA|nr:hypothetical protein F8M41_011128 [Gigaspora margarita]